MSNLATESRDWIKRLENLKDDADTIAAEMESDLDHSRFTELIDFFRALDYTRDIAKKAQSARVWLDIATDDRPAITTGDAA